VFTVSAAAPVATKFAFSEGANQALIVNVVSPIAIVVQRQTASGTAVATGTSAITVTLSTGSSGGAFYSNAAGTILLSGSQIVIAAGASDSAGFYYKDSVVSTSTILTASGSLTSATSVFTVSAAAQPKTQTLRPNGPNSATGIALSRSTGLNYNYEAVDEATADDTTYVYRSDKDVNDKYFTDLYDAQDFAGTGTINSVTVYALVKLAAIGDTGTNAGACTVIRTNSKTTTATTQLFTTVGTTWTTLSNSYTQNPQSGNDWTWTEINALQIGVSLMENGKSYDMRCTQVYAIVNYT
jgi:hypothetical protein